MRTASLFACIVIAGCATPYQPEGAAGGYTETRLDNNVFRVGFNGNGYTSAERAEEMALLRSAEVALNNGFSHFVVVDGRVREQQSSVTMPSQSTTTGTVTTFGNQAYGRANTTTWGGQTFLVTKPRSINTIMCFQGRPQIGGMVYDATFLYNSLGSKYMGAAFRSRTTTATPTQAVPREPPAAISARAQTRPIALRWDGLSSLISGTVTLHDGGRRGTIAGTLPSNAGQCEGTYEMTAQSSGVWSITCTNNMTASGTFEAYGAGKGSSGRGKDSNGNAVEYTIGAGS
jgi:hypothetical protein